MPGNQTRLLALDGGGVRGLSSLMILRRLMATVDPASPPKPCNYFDMIGGTSTGGLIAIMLGRLQMTVDECIEAYTSLSDRVFEKKAHRVKLNGRLQGRFDAAELERAVKQILVGRGFDQDMLLKDSSGAPCKVYVLIYFPLILRRSANLSASSARRASRTVTQPISPATPLYAATTPTSSTPRQYGRRAVPPAPRHRSSTPLPSALSARSSSMARSARITPLMCCGIKPRTYGEISCRADSGAWYRSALEFPP